MPGRALGALRALCSGSFMCAPISLADPARRPRISPAARSGQPLRLARYSTRQQLAGQARASRLEVFGLRPYCWREWGWGWVWGE